MRWFRVSRPALIVAFLVGVAGLSSAFGDGDIHKVNHVIVIMQGGHSFDNYFGALAYVPSGPYHNGNGACEPSDHSCVDGLSCAPDGLGGINCTNQNPNVDGTTAFAFHPGLRCVVPALDPSWFHTHLELNFLHPNRASAPLNDGFLLANTLMGQAGSGLENATPNGAMAFYNQNDLPFYYDLAQKFAIEDRYFASVAGPSFPNRSYLLAATSFGHLTSNDALPPPGGYKPVTGTIFDLLSLNGISWANYFQDGPQGSSFLPFSQTWVDPHFLPLATFMAQAAGSSGVEDLPQVSFVDPNFGLAGQASENDERPSTDIQRGQAFVSQVVNAVRNGPYWQDSVIFLIYDEHGGFYDHVAPPAAFQGGARSPDGLAPGQCADLSSPPLSQEPGWGAECWENPFTANDNSVQEAELLCVRLNDNPTGPYPPWCANFDRLGIRVPFLAVSPFSKPHYVGHGIGDHTSIPAFIEARFLRPAGQESLYLTARDQNANALTGLFDFDHSPSLQTAITQALPPLDDCTSPPGMTAQPHKVSLSWNATGQSGAAYIVYRSEVSGGPYDKVNSVPEAITTYTDNTVLGGDTYYYVVTSVDSSGNESKYSSEVSAAVPSP